MGVDVARYGDDATVLYWRDDQGIRGREVRRGLSTMETAGLIKVRASSCGIPAKNVHVDDGGLGGGVTDRLAEQHFKVRAVNFGSAARDNVRFLNCRAELYWRVRTALEAGVTSLAGDKALASELTWPHFQFASNGKLKIEPKDDIKERMGRSPDLADAYALTYADDGKRTARVGKVSGSGTEAPDERHVKKTDRAEGQ